MNKKFLRALLYSALAAVVLYLLLLYGYRNWVGSENEIIDSLSEKFENKEECVSDGVKYCSDNGGEICLENVESYCSNAFPE